MHRSVEAGAKRERGRRFVGLMLGAPFFLVPAIVLVSLGRADLPLLAAYACAVAGLCWSAAVLFAGGMRQGLLESAMLAVATLAMPLFVAFAGGAQSPVLPMALALAIEAWWVCRTKAAVFAGILAAFFAIIAGTMLASRFALPGHVSPLQWLVPFLYAATLWLRLGTPNGERSEEARIDSSPVEKLIDGVVLRFGRSGEVLDASAQSDRLLRLSPSLLLGTAFFDRVHLADRVSYLSAIADMREGAGRRRVEIRLRLPRHPGEERDNYHPFLVELMDGGDGGFLALLRDNEETVSLRADLARTRQAADSTEVAKSRFLAAVSHELRTPLNAILGFSDMLLQEMFGGFADPRQKEYVGIIRQSGHHLLTVVNSILDVSKIEAGTYTITPEPFAFTEAVGACSSMMRHQAEAKSVAISERVPATIGEICADRRAIQQILINLLSNAVKFTPDGGDVEIGARKSGSWLSFWVSDTGIGISEEDMARLGRPFTQVRNDYTRQFEGTGLGLSLVKGLVSLHRGEMSIESAPGKGTLVTIRLPIDGPMPVERNLARREPVMLPERKGKEAADEAKRKSA
ncbi:MAG TPA: ATP-binding protein [Rhizobiaceae bacterium]|nr:ATP-binding protein [Rhizobiaceae bacterium]